MRAHATHITWAGEFGDPELERSFAESSPARARASALLCVVATTLTSLSFVPLDLIFLPAERLPFFLGDRLVIALLGLGTTLALTRASGLRQLLTMAYGHQFIFFTLNALVFNHPALLRHGGVLVPLISILLMICMPGSFRAAATLCAFAPGISLLFWGVLRPQPEAPLDLAIVALMTLVAYVVGAVARTQLNRMRREEHLHNQTLLEAKEAAEAGSRAKADFLAVMSHEIRTPINGVLGMLHLVLDTGLPAEERHRLETARQSAEGLLTILDDILDITKLEAGRVEFESEPFDLRRTIEDVATLMAARAREKGLGFTLELAQDLPDWVCGDSARLRQILFNLTGNAVKFTEIGSVTVHATPCPAAGDRVGIELAVTDTGIGIDADQRVRLFEAFGQADASINRRFGGTGLGLAVSRRLAEGMGGAIDFDSAPGRGSQFRVTLDFAPAQAVAPIPALPAASLRPLSVLLAEDNPVNAEVALAYLRKAGHAVTLAFNGAEALELAQRGGFDLILMDMRMPEMDGLEATRRIRALPPPLGMVPIIALTANAMRADVERCRDAGMDSHLAKPMTPAALNAAIARVLGRRSSTVAVLCFDLLVAGDCGALAAQLRGLGHRVFAVADDAALSMLAARPFDLVVVGGADVQSAHVQRIEAFRQAAARHHPPPQVVSDDESAETMISRLTEPTTQDLNELLGAERLAQLRGLLLDGLRQHVGVLASPALDAERLAQIAHRIKGSAATLGLEALAAAADRALRAAEDGDGHPEALDAVRNALYTTVDGLIVDALGAPRINCD
ncbi:MAG: response regulator [Rhodospirillaceae bacterium]|nr:response regulator [Rhodospirillales bacterium]